MNHLLPHPQSTLSLYNLELVFCQRCAFLFLLKGPDSGALYKNYPTRSEWKVDPNTPTLIETIKDCVDRQALILDIGANDGDFLARLRQAGFTRLVGIEPTPASAESARSKGLDIENVFLNPTSMRGPLAKYKSRVSLISLRQTLEHIDDLTGFMQCLASLMRDDGFLVIEVPDCDIFFDYLDYAIWEAHPNYFSEHTLHLLLAQHGFQIISSTKTIFSGRNLRVLAKLGRETKSTDDSTRVARAKEWVALFAPFRRFVRKAVLEEAAGRESLLYGVGARSSMFFNLMGLGDFVKSAVEDNPSKIGMYMPGSLTPIFGSSDITDWDHKFVLLGVNYENEENVRLSHPLLNGKSILPPSDTLLWRNFLDEFKHVESRNLM